MYVYVCKNKIYVRIIVEHVTWRICIYIAGNNMSIKYVLQETIQHAASPTLSQGSPSVRSGMRAEC